MIRNISSQLQKQIIIRSKPLNPWNNIAKAYLSTKQEFVKEEFEAGEFDAYEKDPLHKPKWKNKARFMSVDELNNAPQVYLQGQNPTMEEIGFIPSYLFAEQRDGIYDMYLELMHTQQSTSSHEYICYVIAQKFNICKERVAAVIQDRHDEEQWKKDGNETYDDLQELMDNHMKDFITKAYSDMKQRPVYDFIEDPAYVSKESRHSSSGCIPIDDDLFNEDDAEKAAQERLEEKAKFILNNKRFIEDLPRHELLVNIDENCHELMKQQKKFLEIEPPEKKDYVRTKFLCKVIDTQKDTKKIRNRDLRQKKKQDNVLYEENGKLRAATFKEIDDSSPVFKPPQSTIEKMYKNVKEAWLDKKLNGNHDAWGKAEIKEALD